MIFESDDANEAQDKKDGVRLMAGTQKRAEGNPFGPCGLGFRRFHLERQRLGCVVHVYVKCSFMV